METKSKPSRAQTISREGYAAVFDDPPATGYKSAFDHAAGRRSSSKRGS